jgi:hypothetical protein
MSAGLLAPLRSLRRDRFPPPGLAPIRGGIERVTATAADKAEMAALSDDALMIERAKPRDKRPRSSRARLSHLTALR